jgi:hypothetical protein
MARGRHENPVKPWEWLGITYCAYLKRIKNGKPLDNGRFSGQKYEKTAEELAAIREKYKNGVSKEIIEEMMEVKL